MIGDLLRYLLDGALCLFLVWMVATIFIAPNSGMPPIDEEPTYYDFRLPLVPVPDKENGGWGWLVLEGQLTWHYALATRMYRWWKNGFPTRWGKSD